MKISDSFDLHLLIIIEELSPIGGLSDYLKILSWKHNINCEIIDFSLKDEFIHSYSSHDDLLELHGLSMNFIDYSMLFFDFSSP